MPTIQSPRGTRDILPDAQEGWNTVRSHAAAVASAMGYSQVTTPTYEEVGLFQRSIGSGTDVMDKELFLVRGIQDEQAAPYALRPEGTAGIVRSFIEHGMHTWPQPVKLWSFVNCFRYDRPQKGRYREHVQFDIEYFGDKGPFADAWVIYTTWQFLMSVGLTGLELHLNSLGTKEEREAYVAILKDYYTPLQDKLSQDSSRRLESNPLRLLDSKDEGDRALRESAPLLIDHLGDASSEHLESVKRYLTLWEVPFTIDPFLVRGLDYYSHTAFEWTVANKEGQQNSLGGGGRYDGLVQQLGGQDVGAVGAGIGLDRVIEEALAQGLDINKPASGPTAYVIAADEQGKLPAATAILALLKAGISVDANLGKTNVPNQLKQAARLRAGFALIFGELEVAQNVVTLKDLASGEQQQLTIEQVVEKLA